MDLDRRPHTQPLPGPVLPRGHLSETPPAATAARAAPSEAEPVTEMTDSLKQADVLRPAEGGLGRCSRAAR